LTIFVDLIDRYIAIFILFPIQDDATGPGMIMVEGVGWHTGGPAPASRL
jgi:hypothetical protein